jgi:signal transduction histidine kinase
MLGFAELLEVTQLDEVQRKYLGTMQASASSLMSVINDLLDFSKMYVGFSVKEEQSNALLFFS